MNYHRRKSNYKLFKAAAIISAAVLMTAPANANNNQTAGKSQKLVVPMEQAVSLPQAKLVISADAIENTAKTFVSKSSKRTVIRENYEYAKDYARAATYDVFGDSEAFIAAEKTRKIDLREYNDSALTPEGRFQRPLVSNASVGLRRTF